MDGPPIPYKLTFEERPRYLYARISAGSIDRATALAYLRQVAGKCGELECRRLMLERDIPAMLPDGDLFFTTRDFLEMIGTTKVAFVNPYVPIKDEMGFAIMIGTNRGANYKLFDNASAAEEWLLDTAESASFARGDDG